MTLDGARLLDRLQQAISMINDSVGQAAETADVEVLHVSVVPSFARMILLPNLRKLEGSPPDLRVEVEIDQKVVSLSDARVPIRHGDGHWPGVHATPLIAESLVPVASKDFVATHGLFREPKDVLEHPLILDAPDKNWKTWFAASDIDYKVRKCDRIFSDYDLSVMAAAECDAIALLRYPLGNDLIASCNLQIACEKMVQSPTRFHAVVQIGRRNRLIDRFVSRLSRECADVERIWRQEVPGPERT